MSLRKRGEGVRAELGSQRLPAAWLLTCVTDTEIRTKGVQHSPHHPLPLTPLDSPRLGSSVKWGDDVAFQGVMSVLSRPCSKMKSKVWYLRLFLTLPANFSCSQNEQGLVGPPDKGLKEQICVPLA